MIRENVLYEIKTKEIEELYRKLIFSCKECSGHGHIYRMASKKEIKNSTLKEIVENNDNRKTRCICSRKFMKEITYLVADIPMHYAKIFDDSIHPREVTSYQEKKRYDLGNIVNQYSRNFEQARREGLGFIFMGRNGTGKTAMAVKILMSALRKKYSGYYVEFATLLSHIIRGYEKDIYAKMVREIIDVDFLVIDEIGKEPKTSVHALGQFESIMKKRIGLNQPTILVLNLDFDTFQTKYGPSIISQLMNNYMVLVFKETVDERSTRKTKQWRSIIKV